MRVSAMSDAKPDDPSQTLSSPTPANERISLIDMLRGFALFGILLVNFPGSEASRSGAVDDAVRRLLWMLVSGKFYTTFSFLFGLGFALQFLRAQSRGRRIVPVYIRRMLVLFLIGLGHAVLIWNGDVLMIYAVMGFFLIPLRNRSARVLLPLAALCLAGEFFLSIKPGPVFVRDLVPRTVNPELEQESGLQKAIGFNDLRDAFWRLQAATKSGSYFDAVIARFNVLRASIPYLWRYVWLTSFAMFLIGLYTGRCGLIRNPPAPLGLIRKVMWISLPIWLGFGAIATHGPQLLGVLYFKIPNKLLTLAWVIQEPAGSLFYISAILFLLARRPHWISRLAPLGAVGRMALTNYLLQSVLGTALYYGYGLGLELKLGNFAGLVLGMAVFALQIPLSTWWLRRFRFGPFEWLWRSLTYGKVQPILAPKLQPAEA